MRWRRWIESRRHSPSRGQTASGWARWSIPRLERDATIGTARRRIIRAFVVRRIPRHTGRTWRDRICARVLKPTAWPHTVDGKYLGDPASRPHGGLNRRKGVVYIHPRRRRAVWASWRGTVSTMIATIRAHTPSLCSRHCGEICGIRFMVSHGGGTVTFLLGRSTAGGGEKARDAECRPNCGVIDEIAQDHTRAARALRRCPDLPGAVGATSLRPVSEAVRASQRHLPAAEQRAIEYDHAVRFSLAEIALQLSRATPGGPPLGCGVERWACPTPAVQRVGPGACQRVGVWRM